MAITSTTTFLNSLSYSFTQTDTGTARSESETVFASCPYTYGSGNFEVNLATVVTGVLPSGGSVTIDLTAVSKTYLGLTTSVGFSGIKGIIISNKSANSGWNMSVAATGSNPMTDIFNGGSGNLMIYPYSSFSFNNPYGIRTSSTKKNITIRDVAGSGAYYSVGIIGTNS